MIEFDISEAQCAALGIEQGDMTHDGTFPDCVWVVLRRINE